MPVHALPPVTNIQADFTGVDEIPASGVGISDYMHPLGYNHFMCYCKCDRAAYVQIQFSEDHSDWYLLQDKSWSDVLSEHDNATVGTVATTVTPTTQMHAVMIHNTHASQNILISFDEGTTWTTLTPDRSISIPDNSYDFQIKGSAAGTTYESIITRYLWGCMVKAGSNKTFRFDATGLRYIRVVVRNLDTVNALAGEVDVKAMQV